MVWIILTRHSARTTINHFAAGGKSTETVVPTAADALGTQMLLSVCSRTLRKM